MRHCTFRSIFLKVSTLFLVSFFVLACSVLGEKESNGTVSLSLTDAPVADAAGVEGVFITIQSIEYNLNGEWVDADGFEGPKKFNLLDLTGGKVAALGDTSLKPGKVEQIRFMLSAEKEGSQQGSQETSGCYIAFDNDGAADGDESDDTKHNLFVPSGDQTGYKATGSFTIPENGTVEITADFDVRKSVVVRGKDTNASYLLKPTIKLIVNNQAGSIKGSFTKESSDSYASHIVFAYEKGTYTDTEATAADDTSAPFPGAASSATVETGEYKLPFLAAGSYDLVVAGVDAEGNYTVIDKSSYTGLAVESEKASTQNIDFSASSGS